MVKIKAENYKNINNFLKNPYNCCVVCVHSKIEWHFDQRSTTLFKKSINTLTFSFYQIKMGLSRVLSYIIFSKLFFGFYYLLFIIIYNFIIFYSFLFISFMLFICFYFVLFLEEKMIYFRKWGLSVDPHFFYYVIKKLGGMFNMVFNLLKLFELDFILFGGVVL